VLAFAVLAFAGAGAFAAAALLDAAAFFGAATSGVSAVASVVVFVRAAIRLPFIRVEAPSQLSSTGVMPQHRDQGST
jgi:hypothetical protein